MEWGVPGGERGLKASGLERHYVHVNVSEGGNLPHTTDTLVRCRRHRPRLRLRSRLRLWSFSDSDSGSGWISTSSRICINLRPLCEWCWAMLSSDTVSVSFGAAAAAAAAASVFVLHCHAKCCLLWLFASWWLPPSAACLPLPHQSSSSMLSRINKA